MTLDVKIVVFVDVPNTVEQANQIKALTKTGYSILVDSIHKRDYHYLHKNTVSARMFVQEDEDLFMFDRNDLKQDMLLVPDFAVIFHDDTEIINADWVRIYKFIEQHLYDLPLDKENTELVEDLLGKPVTMAAEPANEEIIIARGNDFYNLETKFLEEEDIMLYEVTKPFTDLPYTSVTRNFSKKGHLPFFTDLFICQSWGVARNDIMFLKHTWEQFKMDGVFDLEALMKAATEKCLPSETNLPEPEPEVYRRDLKHVEEIISEKKSRKSKVIPEYIKNKSTHV